ncbi:sugar transferase [Mariniphaga sp.]|uniref:sugar transferase n=1 Tax=Mariniphaga sp. TaxID=1954475 RepID=UPI003561DD89
MTKQFTTLRNMYKQFFKRFFDFLIAFTGIIVISPLFILLILILSVANQGAGVFFTQKRPGKNEKIFRVVKFKTMTDEKDKNGNLLPESQRLTKTGRFIRQTSLDEIPQLINVLKGDMSLIGPRPLLIEYLPLYNKQQARRHEVRPGITGWAQVNGRNAISWEQKFTYDVWYVDNLSFLLDLKVLFLTLYKVIKRSDIYMKDNLIMEKFNGKN